MPIPAFLFIPLINFHSNVRPVEFGKFFKLTKLSDEESALLQGPLRIGKASTISLVQTKFKLQAEFEIEGNEYKVPAQMFSELGDILTAMRLTQAGDVGVLHVFAGYAEKGGNKVHGMINTPSEWEAVDPGGLYLLNANVLPRINGIFDLLQKKRTRPLGGTASVLGCLSAHTA